MTGHPAANAGLFSLDSDIQMIEALPWQEAEAGVRDGFGGQ